MAKLVFTQNTCPICGASILEKKYYAYLSDYRSEQSFPIYICLNCGYGRTEDIQKLSNSIYIGGSYDLKEKRWHKLIKPFLSKIERGKLRYLDSEKVIGKKLLEIGCGKGRFLEAAREKGFQVYGIEPSLRSYSFASARLGNSVAPIGLEDIDKAAEFPSRFDYVVLWHVLEHLADPSFALSEVRKRLLDNGRVIVAVPNFASYQARFGKADWYHLDPPRHVHHFTPESLRILALKNGLHADKFIFNSFYQNYVGEIITITNKMLPGKNVVFNGLRLNHAYLHRFGIGGAWIMFILGCIISVFIAFPVFLYTLFNQLLGRAGTMVVIMRPIENKQ